MKTRSFVLVTGMLILGSLLVTGCGKAQTDPHAFRDERLRVAFNYPTGWSQLSPREWRERDMGRNQTAVTIMDAERDAGFSVIPVNMNIPDQQATTTLGKQVGPRTAMLLDSVEKAGPGKYQSFRLLEKGPTTFANTKFGHIVYEGQKPGKDMRWWRMVIIMPPERTPSIVMLLFSTPVDDQETFDEAFRHIENSWQWL